MTAVMAERATREVLSLGDVYVSDFLAPDEQPRSEPWPLTLEMDADGMVHLAEQPPAELMWGRYWYRSGTNQSMKLALADVVQSTLERVELGHGTPTTSSDGWLDIACNDGTLLSMVPPWLRRVGVDPAEEAIVDQARGHADHVVRSPFTFDTVCDFRPFRVVSCVAMFYDLLDPHQFLVDVRNVMHGDGVFVLQMSYTPLMLEQLAFDNVCHEHARYYTLTTLAAELGRAGMTVVDAELNDVNGGSLRVYAMRDGADVSTFGSAPFRDVAAFRVGSILAIEDAERYNDPRCWFRFRAALVTLRYDVRTLVTEIVAGGGTVYGYGASTKGNTLLQYFGLDRTLITAIAERQPGKVGLRTVGTDIPIVSEDEARAANPDYMLMLPWHFVSEFRRRESAYLAAGGRFIVPCPTLQVVTA